jgi:hypothetical protein
MADEMMPRGTTETRAGRAFVRVQGPNGKRIRILAPEGLDGEELRAFAVARSHEMAKERERAKMRGYGGWYICASGCSGNCRHDVIDSQVETDALSHLGTLAGTLSAPWRERRPPVIVDHSARRDRLARRRANLVEAIADGTIRRDDARAKLAEIDAELNDIDQQDRAAISHPIPVEVRREALAETAQIRRAWRRLAVADKREVVAMLQERIEIDRDREARKWARNVWEVRASWRNLRYSSQGSWQAPQFGGVPFAALRSLLLAA